MSNLFARSAMRWIPVKNTDSVPAPPYALLAVTGVDNEGNFTVTRPTSDSQQGLLVNCSFTIPAGQQGQAHATFPAIVAYDSEGNPSDAPQAGESWGSIAPDSTGRNAWALQKGYGGFTVLSTGANGLCNVVPAQASEAWIKVTSASLSTITLASGSTLKGYAAKIDTWDGKTTDGTNPSWADGTVVWFIGVNGEAPTANQRYQCRLLGVDDTGVAIWASVAAQQDQAWVKVTNSTPTTITLTGGSVTGYAAKLSTWSASLGTWTDTTVVWFIGANSETPITGVRYQCRSMGQDSSGTAIWAAQFAAQPQFIEVTSTTPASVPGTALTGYPAQDINSVACWWVALNSEVSNTASAPLPKTSWWYPALLYGADSAGKLIYKEAFPPDATATNWGVVTTTTQTFAGAKSFDDAVEVASNSSPSGTSHSNGSFGIINPIVAGATAIFADVGPNYTPASSFATTVMRWLHASTTSAGSIIDVQSSGAQYPHELDWNSDSGGLMIRFAWGGAPTYPDAIVFATTAGGIPDIGLGGANGSNVTYRGQATTQQVVTGVDFVGQTVTTVTLHFTSGLLTSITTP